MIWGHFRFLSSYCVTSVLALSIWNYFLLIRLLICDTDLYDMSTSRVYIGRLPSRATERDVEHFFRGFGRIRDVVLKNGFGFVVSTQILSKGKFSWPNWQFGPKPRAHKAWFRSWLLYPQPHVLNEHCSKDLIAIITRN